MACNLFSSVFAFRTPTYNAHFSVWPFPNAATVTVLTHKRHYNSHQDLHHLAKTLSNIQLLKIIKPEWAFLVSDS